METTVTKHINEILVNDVLGEDIFNDDRLIISKGIPLTKRLITLLKNRSIKEVKIKVIKTTPYFLDEEITVRMIVETVENNSQEDFHAFFLEHLKRIANESRYGNLLSSSKDLDLVLNLFSSIFTKYNYIDSLYKMKEWDYYTFIHSLDVFILGSLLARQQGIEDLETTTFGYLFHDIGKLQTPRELLTLERKLSHNEFTILKAHTLEGFDMLQSIGLGSIAQYAKSHHERVDGSGYPEQLTDNDLTLELKILHIVDVYSALTLNRPYREALSASKALELIFRDAHRYDSKLLYDFIDLLQIYPNNSTVLLSDHTYAKIVQPNELLPMFPVVKRSNDLVDFHLPYNFEIKIYKMIEFQSQSFQERFKETTENLIKGHENELQKCFLDLSDNLKIEEIYSQIIIPLYRVIKTLFDAKMLSAPDYNTHTSSIIRLLQISKDSILDNNDYNTQVLLIIEGNERPFIHLKILESLLHLENVYPLILIEPMSAKLIEKTVTYFNINSVFVFNSNGNFEKSFTLTDVIFRCIAYRDLEKTMDTPGYLFDNSSRIYKWLVDEQKC